MVFTGFTPEEYNRQLADSSIPEEKRRNLQNQMVAATYRFYKNCTQCPGTGTGTRGGGAVKRGSV